MVFRIWDIFFLKGMDFIINLVLSMFSEKKEKIMQLKGGELLVYIKDLPKTVENIFEDLIDKSLCMKNTINDDLLKSW